MAFEDTPNGLRSARSVGIPVIVTASLYGGTAGFGDAMQVVDSLGEPDAPCRVLAGPPLSGPMLDVPALRRLAPVGGPLGQ